MAFPKAAKRRVRRKPLARSECTTLKPATTKEWAVTALDSRGSIPLTPHLLSHLLSSTFIRVTPVPRNAERIAGPYLREGRGTRNGTALR
jgi:hypothetical protein